MGRWDNRLIDQASDVPSIIFFHNFLQNSLQKLFQFIFNFFYKFTKMKIKSFESIRKYEKYNALNIRCLVSESFVPSTQRIMLKIVGFLSFFCCNYSRLFVLSTSFFMNIGQMNTTLQLLLSSWYQVSWLLCTNSNNIIYYQALLRIFNKTLISG